MFVLSLRGQYSNKVKTFRQVIEVHRLELNQKQQYWDEALVVSWGSPEVGREGVRGEHSMWRAEGDSVTK